MFGRLGSFRGTAVKTAWVEQRATGYRRGVSADDLPSVWLDPPPAIESDWLQGWCPLRRCRRRSWADGPGDCGAAGPRRASGCRPGGAFSRRRDDRPLDGEGHAASGHRTVQDREKPF